MKKYKVIMKNKVSRSDSAIYVQQLIRKAHEEGIIIRIYDEEFNIEINERVIKEDVKLERISLRNRMDKYNKRR